MKKLAIVILTLCLGMSIFSGCKKTSLIENEKELKNISEKASNYTDMFIAEEYDSIVKNFDTTIKASVSANQLKDAWVATTKNAGEVKDIKIAVEGFTAVSTITFTGGSAVAVTFTFSPQNGKIEGLWLKPAQGEIELTDNELFKESSVLIGEYDLLGVYTVPKNNENTPIVVMVQGSGQSDYDETVGKANNKPFRDIAHALGEQGIATLRFNKRFFQKPDIATKELTIYDEYMEDVKQAIVFCQDKGYKNIYVLGHSLGGMSVPKIAKDNPAVSGIISMAGTIRGLEDVMYDQNMQAIAEMQTTQQQKDVLIKQVKEQFDAVKALKIGDKTAPFGVHATYWLSLKSLDTENISKQLQIPMLILQGSADFQVNTEKDFKAWKTALEGKDNAQFMLYEGLTHMFMPQKLSGKLDIAEYDIENNIPKYVTDDIAVWIKSNSK